jgi:hypothetical protein
LCRPSPLSFLVSLILRFLINTLRHQIIVCGAGVGAACSINSRRRSLYNGDLVVDVSDIGRDVRHRRTPVEFDQTTIAQTKKAAGRISTGRS